mgnify:CR=1 FL=1
MRIWILDQDWMKNSRGIMKWSNTLNTFRLKIKHWDLHMLPIQILLHLLRKIDIWEANLLLRKAKIHFWRKNFSLSWSNSRRRTVNWGGIRLDWWNWNKISDYWWFYVCDYGGVIWYDWVMINEGRDYCRIRQYSRQRFQ